MKNLTSLLLSFHTFVWLFLLVLPGRTVSQMDLVLHEIDPGYEARHIAEDFAGNTIICGIRQIRKLGPNSEWVWATEMLPAESNPGIGFIHDMVVDGLGNIYLAGQYRQSVQFGTIVLTSLSNTNDLFAAKLDPNGNFLWAKSFGTSGGTDAAEGIALDAGGNVYITGTFFNKTCSGAGNNGLYIRDLYVAKLTNAGNAVWQKRFPPSKLQCQYGGSGFEIKVDGAGNVYTTGDFNGTFKFGNGTALSITSLGNGDVFLLKLNSSGTPQWAKSGNGVAGEKSRALYVDGDGNVIIGGHFGSDGNGSVSFAPYTLPDVDGDGPSYYTNPCNAFLVKYLANGSVAWAINPGTIPGYSNEVNGIIGKSANEIYVSLPILGVKTFATNNGSQQSFTEMVDNLYVQEGNAAMKNIIYDLAPSAEGYLLSLHGYCGTVTYDNLALTNESCVACVATCYTDGVSELFLIRSATAPALNTPITNRSTPEIEGHTYLGTFNGHTYYISDCPTSWYDALYAALEMGGYLASITSQEEDYFLAPFAPMISCASLAYSPFDRIGGAWVGLLLHDQDQNGDCLDVSWANGEPLGYTNWYPYGFDEAEPIGCGWAAIIGYPGGNNIGFCPLIEYKWFTNYYLSSTSRYIVEFDQDPSCSQPGKTYVCHNGNTLCINESALQGHLNHGDYAGPCGPCNANYAGAPSVISDYTTTNAVPVSIGKDNQQDYFSKEPVSRLDVYPNPASDEINIRFDHSTPARIIIYDLFGSLIWSGPSDPFTNQIQIRLDDRFTDGVYVLHAIQEGRQVVKRFVVSR